MISNIFQFGDETVKFLKVSGRAADEIKLVERYSKAQGLWEDYKKNKINKKKKKSKILGKFKSLFK